MSNESTALATFLWPPEDSGWICNCLRNDPAHYRWKQAQRIGLVRFGAASGNPPNKQKLIGVYVKNRQLFRAWMEMAA